MPEVDPAFQYLLAATQTTTQQTQLIQGPKQLSPQLCKTLFSWGTRRQSRLLPPLTSKTLFLAVTELRLKTVTIDIQPTVALSKKSPERYKSSPSSRPFKYSRLPLKQTAPRSKQALRIFSRPKQTTKKLKVWRKTNSPNS